MTVDPSWDAVPVVKPDLPARKRRKVLDRALLTDPVGIARPSYQLERRDLLVVPSTLDQPSRELLLRAQKAIAAAVDGREFGATGAGDAVPESTLLWHEWEIAVALRELTDLREEHSLNAATAGPMTQVILRPQQGALERAHEAITARVAALETYAQRVSAAAAAYQDWQDALRIADLNDRYLDLVARTAADELAVAEFGEMTDRVTAAQTFHQAIREVSLAAAALELPRTSKS